MSACYAGVYNRSIVTNAQMTASTFWGAKHEPFQARLHNVISATSIGAWAQKGKYSNPVTSFRINNI